MKTIEYSLEIKQKRGEAIVNIDFGRWKKVRCKYNKSKRTFEATLTGFDGESKKVEYLDVISVSKTKSKK